MEWLTADLIKDATIGGTALIALLLVIYMWRLNVNKDVSEDQTKSKESERNDEIQSKLIDTLNENTVAFREAINAFAATNNRLMVHAENTAQTARERNAQQGVLSDKLTHFVEAVDMHFNALNKNQRELILQDNKTYDMAKAIYERLDNALPKLPKNIADEIMPLIRQLIDECNERV